MLWLAYGACVGSIVVSIAFLAMMLGMPFIPALGQAIWVGAIFVIVPAIGSIVPVLGSVVAAQVRKRLH